MTAKTLMNAPLIQIFARAEDVQIPRARTGVNVMRALNLAETENNVLTVAKDSASDSSLVVCVRRRVMT